MSGNFAHVYVGYILKLTLLDFFSVMYMKTGRKKKKLVKIDVS